MGHKLIVQMTTVVDDNVDNVVTWEVAADTPEELAAGAFEIIDSFRQGSEKRAKEKIAKRKGK